MTTWRLVFERSFSGVRAVSGIMTNAAVALAAGNIRFYEVIAGQRMPFWAMRFGRVDRSKPVASQRVLSERHRSAVVRIAASPRSVVADVMVELHSFGDRTDFSLVSKAMNETHPPLIMDLSVPFDVRSLPDVAPVRISNPSYLRRPLASTWPWVPRNEDVNHATILAPNVTRIKGVEVQF